MTIFLKLRKSFKSLRSFANTCVVKEGRNYEQCYFGSQLYARGFGVGSGVRETSWTLRVGGVNICAKHKDRIGTPPY